MKLIGSLTSPFVRKVRAVLVEKKIDFVFDVMSPWDADNHVSDFNPLGKVPVFVLDDGTCLFDSRVIVEYLDTSSPFNKLIPTPNRDKAEVKRWEALADGVCDAAATIVLERRRPVNLQSADVIKRHHSKVVNGLSFMDAELALTQEKHWCTGTSFSLADIAVGCALGFLEFRFSRMDWPKQCPNLKQLYARLMQRPSFIETVPKEP